MAPLPPHWTTPKQGHWPMMPQALQPWLWEGHSMTSRLQQHVDQLHIEVITQYWQQPDKQITQACQLPPQAAFFREVVLSNANTPWIVARSIIPKAACQRSGGTLTRLGQQPLGSYLYKDCRVQRMHLAWACLKPCHSDFHWAQAYYPQPLNMLWARRSALQWRQCSIIVFEIFLPTVYEHAC
jgi:chorismate lyase